MKEVGEKESGIIVNPILSEVSFIRPILIVFLVLYHALCIHTGRWELPDGVTLIPAYKGVARLIYGFMLENPDVYLEFYDSY